MTTEKLNNLIYASIEFDTSINPVYKKAYQTKIFYEPFTPIPRLGADLTDSDMCIDLRDTPPLVDRSFNKSFEEITDYRSQEVAAWAGRTDSPIVILWSGGIDSTTALSAMIKHFDRPLLDRLHVRMNWASYYENPWFYEKIIKKNKINCDTHGLDWQNSLILTGSCADSLWIQANILEIENWHPGSYTRSLREPDTLIEWITHRSDSVFAREIFDLIVDNSTQADMNLHTYEDFFWWANFNFYWTGQIYKYVNTTIGDVSNVCIDLDLFRDRCRAWYDNDHYQLWSINNRSNGVKFSGSMRSYKKPAKDYIYDLDKNPWYRDYKLKTGGDLVPSSQKIKAIRSNGQIIV